MDVNELVFMTLRDDPTVAALVNARIFPQRLPDVHDWPCISYFLVFGLDVTDLAGRSGLENDQVQIDCWSDTSQRQAFLVSNAVRDAVDAAPALGSASFERRSVYESVGKRYRVQIDVSCWVND